MSTPSVRRPLILVSNDDGHFAEGLKTLVEAVSPLGDVVVCAPEAEQSAAAHAISLHRPLRIKQVREGWYAVDGTPTDCTYVAINHILKDRRPDLCVSGINHGPNLADDVTYSGTVAAAMEASILGVPAIAFSLASRKVFEFGPAGRFAHEFVKAALAQRQLPARLLVNVNIPAGVEPDGYVVTRLGRHSYGFDVVEGVDPRGRKYYWIGGSDYQHDDVPGSDCNIVYRDKRVSVTPLHLELTDERVRPTLSTWRIDGFAQHPALDRLPGAGSVES